MSAAAPVAAVAREAEFRASGTDLSERRRSGVSLGALIDILPTPDMTGIAWDATGAARIGASTSIAAIAGDARLAAAYPGIAAAAAGLATPQIRRLATLGGNLAQRTRCWYYRNPHIDCLKKGGAACPARARAITCIASPSISGPASRPTPRPWRRRCSPMTRGSRPTSALPSRSRNSSATDRTARRIMRLKPAR
jgi:CO/xanthine dehydrogenase FAD-binding subunit